MNRQYGVLTEEALYRASAAMRTNRDLALAANDKGLAQSFQDRLDVIVEELILRNTDPFTTAADIWFFENNG